jgi:hypothetical protein
MKLFIENKSKCSSLDNNGLGKDVKFFEISDIVLYRNIPVQLK